MIFSLLSPSGSRAKLSILIWHRVLPHQDDIFPGEMHASRFNTILGWIKRSFNVLPLGQAVQQLKAGCLPARALSITFDDGYEDNHSVALPLLKKHGLSAMFFIATGFLDKGRMWNDSVIETVRRCKSGVLDTGDFGCYELGDAASRCHAIESLLGKIKYLDFDTRLKTVMTLSERANVVLPDNMMMSEGQVRELRQQGMEIGGHTCRHPILSRLPADAARSEIADGKIRLEKIIGERITVFAYPNGVPGKDYSHDHVNMVREAGFEAAVSTAWGASGSQDDIFQLRRFSPWDETRFAFLLRMGRNLMAK